MSGGRSRPTPGQLDRFLGREGTWEVLIGLVAVALFAPTVGYGWVFDDQMEIVLNPLIRSLSNLPAIFSTTVWAGSGMETYLYRPLALVTYSLNHMVSGLAPWSYHLFNVLLHAGTSVLVFRVGRLWGLPVLAAGLGGLIFAVHPVHVEVVAAVFGRKDLLAGFFTLAMVLLHGPAVRRGGWRLALPVLAYAGALLSKEVGVVGIALVAAQDWLLTKDRSRLARDGRTAGLYVGYVATLLAYVLVRNRITGGVGVPDTFYMDNPLVVAPLGVRLATALAVIGKGLALQAFPLTLSPDYSFDAIPVVGSILDWRFLGTVTLLAAGAWALSRAGSPLPQEIPVGGERAEGELDHDGVLRSPSALLLLAALYFISVLPTANILVTVGTIFGERLVYLPSVAFSLLVGIGVAWLAGGISEGPDGAGPWAGKIRRLGAFGGALWIGAIAIQAIAYSRAWDNDIALFRYAVASVPNSTKANHKLGEELLRVGEVGPSLPYLRRALEIAPDNEFAAGTLAGARRRLAQQYLPPDPGSTPPPLPADPEILYVLGQMSRERGDLEEAERLWRKALEADPNHAPSQRDMGAARLIQGDTAAAIEHLQAAIRLDPSMARAWFGLSQVYVAKGRNREARRALEAFIDAAGTRFPDQVRWARETLSRLPFD